MSDTRYELGPHKPVGAWVHGTYIGPIEELRGKGALLTFNGKNQYIAQFDDVSTGYGHGWHTFNGFEFEADAVDNSPTFSAFKLGNY